jgi:hypothetical protein
MFSKTLARTGLIAGLAINAVNAIPTISAVGTKFFDSDGKQFYIKGTSTASLRKTIANHSIGIAYQLTVADPLIDSEQCQRDASLMKTLGANVIRVYHVDPTGDHSGCMSALANAGIYLMVDLDTFTTAIPGVSYPSQW